MPLQECKQATNGWLQDTKYSVFSAAVNFIDLARMQAMAASLQIGLGSRSVHKY